MFNKILINNCFRELVGWRWCCGDEVVLGPSLQTSFSGLYVNDLPLVDFELIKETLKEKYAGDVDAYLTDVHESETFALLNRFINGLKQEINTKELLSNCTAIAGVSNTQIVQESGAKGFLIKPRESNSLLTTVNHLGLHLNADQTLRVFLYDTSKKYAIATFDFDYTDEQSSQWREVTDFLIYYQSTQSGTGQEFLLIYYEDNHSQAWELQPANFGYGVDFMNCECARIKRQFQQFVGIQPISIPSDQLNWDGTTYLCPDVDLLNNWIDTKTAGLNFKMSTTCDITQVLCANKYMFAEAIQIAIGMRVLTDVYVAIRFNSTAERKREQCKEVRDELKTKLEGGWFGVGTQIRKDRGILQNIEIDFRAIDRICLPPEPEIKIGRMTRSY